LDSLRSVSRSDFLSIDTTMRTLQNRYNLLALGIALGALFSVGNGLMVRHGITSPTPCSNLFGNMIRSTTTTTCNARYRLPYEDEDDNVYRGDELCRQISTDRPTLTFTDVIRPQVGPSKPKIVVLGASGRIGRLVVRELLESNGLDITIVAFVRNYDKAIKVFSDDLLALALAGAKGPKLQIVEGDLVPLEELPGGFDEEEAIFLEQASSSSSSFDGNSVTLPDVNEALEDAIKGCSTVISCVGSVRPTNLFSDFIARPFWRILRADVSRWCKDARHPFYVNYVSTRKALGYAEREQLRREAAVTALAEADESDEDIVVVPKIRFIRISDLCVAHQPWDFVPLITNAFQSMVFRYQEMAEQLLEQSILETVILRPGDLVDEERVSYCQCMAAFDNVHFLSLIIICEIV
jgi:NAD(P)-dependent dehydrogenase (short-subunit alcohol dehydrogenase family)